MQFVKGNLLTAPVEALVNTVNTVGVMGKGIALQFRERFPQNYIAYKNACKSDQMVIGKMFVFREEMLDGEKLIINFPTKKHWRQPSQYNYVEQGLKDLVSVIRHYQIKSLALPPLGCGNGGLDWEIVKQMIIDHLGQLTDVRISVYEPNAQVKQILKEEQTKDKAKLTPARAMLLYALFWYEQFGESASVFAANKIAYLLQQNGEELRLKFVPYYYGPYAQAVEKVLYALNGTYITGLEQMTADPFETLSLNYDRYQEVNEFVDNNLTQAQKNRLKTVLNFISGFESAFSLEILTSVFYLIKKHKTNNPVKLKEAMYDWNEKKSNKITDEYIQIACNHIQKHNPQLEFEFG